MFTPPTFAAYNTPVITKSLAFVTSCTTSSAIYDSSLGVTPGDQQPFMGSRGTFNVQVQYDSSIFSYRCIGGYTNNPSDTPKIFGIVPYSTQGAIYSMTYSSVGYHNNVLAFDTTSPARRWYFRYFPGFSMVKDPHTGQSTPIRPEIWIDSTYNGGGSGPSAYEFSSIVVTITNNVITNRGY